MLREAYIVNARIVKSGTWGDAVGLYNIWKWKKNEEGLGAGLECD